MIQRDITTNPAALRLYFDDLTQTEISHMVADGLLKKRIKYEVTMAGEGPNHTGKIRFQAKYAHVEPASGDTPEVLTEVGSSPWLELRLPPSLIVSILLYGLSTAPEIAGQVVSLYGGMPEIIYTPDPAPAIP